MPCVLCQMQVGVLVRVQLKRVPWVSQTAAAAVCVLQDSVCSSTAEFLYPCTHLPL